MKKNSSKKRGPANPLLSQLPQDDPAANRKRVLAKVYGLLMRLAEEDERFMFPEEVIEKEARVVESEPVQLKLIL